MIQPQLWVHDTAAAADYYARAFDAVVEHRAGAPEDPDGVVLMAIGQARFWVAGTSMQMRRFDARELDGGTARFLLVAEDPHTITDSAVAAGARLTSPVAEEHGWLVGRIVDPFGHEWEIGRPL